MQFILFGLFLAMLSIARSEVISIKDQAAFNEIIAEKSVMIKFFSPNCGWCQRLAPTYIELSNTYNKENPETAIEFAEVDCTENHETCEAAEIRGFPTVRLYLKSENSIEYSGNRTLDDLSTFITVMQRPALFIAETEDEAVIEGKTINPNAHFVFITSIPKNNISEEFMNAMEKVASAFKANTLVGLVADSKDEEYQDEKIHLIGSRDGKSVKFNHEFNFDDETVKAAINFIAANRNPYYPELSGENFRELLSVPNKLLTIVAIDPEVPEQVALVQSIKDAIIADPEVLTNRISPCWVNGQRWISFVSKFLVTPDIFPSVIIIDIIGEHKQYYRYEKLDSVATLSSYIKEVIEGKVEATPLEPSRKDENNRQDIDRRAEMILTIFTFINKHFVLCAVIFALILVSSVAFAIVLCIRCCCRKSSKKIEAEEEKKEEEEVKVTDENENKAEETAIDEGAKEKTD